MTQRTRAHSSDDWYSSIDNPGFTLGRAVLAVAEGATERSGACARPFRAHVVVELRERGEDPFHQFPVDVSSIGSVADRNESPSDFRNALSAKWSYFSKTADRTELQKLLNLLPDAQGQGPFRRRVRSRLPP